jgi:hypothetical protein
MNRLTFGEAGEDYARISSATFVNYNSIEVLGDFLNKAGRPTSTTGTEIYWQMGVQLEGPYDLKIAQTSQQAATCLSKC